jgi:hypothetical protein
LAKGPETLGEEENSAHFHGDRTSDFNGATAQRQALFVTLKNKLQKSVKVLFPVMCFGVSRSQTAETCNTGGVFQDPVVCSSPQALRVNSVATSRRSTVTVLRRMAPTKVTEYG